MTPYMEKLTMAIDAYESKCGITEPESILEDLWYDYSCRRAIDDGQFRQAEKNLSPVFEALSMEASDHLFDQIVELLNAYQRSAYLDGLRIGVHLFQELQ